MDHYNKDKSGIRVQAPICDKQVITELSSDFSLPDYQPEIKRLLRVRTIVSPPDKYIGTGNAEFSGTIDYSIVYSGNDSAIYCANESAEYRFALPIDMIPNIELSEGLTCDVDIVPETAVGRVVAPRKLSVKCRLRARVRLWGIKCMEERLEQPGKIPPERLRGSVECARQFVGIGEPLQLGDEILLDAGTADMRVILAEGQVFVTEATAASGAVNCRGEICLKLLCAQEATAEAPSALFRRIPFTQSVITDGAEVNCDCCASGVCSDIRITVEDGRILCDVTAQLKAKAQRNETVTYTRDLYSTEAECDAVYTTCVLPRAMKCSNGNFSLNTTMPLEDLGIRSEAVIVDVSLVPMVSTLECEGGKYYLGGRCRAQIILFDNEDYAAQEFEIPFRYEADGAKGEITDYDASVDVISCRPRMDGERLGIDAELSVCLSARTESSFEMLSEASFGEKIARTNAGYTICYPAREDTLWSVAKRYHRSIHEISNKNELAGAPAADSPESLMGVKYLLI